MVISYLAEEKGTIQVTAKSQYHIALVVLKNYDLAPGNSGFWQLLDSISAQCPKYQCDFCTITIEKKDPNWENPEQYNGIIVWGIQVPKKDLVQIRSLKVPGLLSAMNGTTTTRTLSYQSTGEYSLCCPDNCLRHFEIFKNKSWRSITIFMGFSD